MDLTKEEEINGKIMTSGWVDI